MLTLIRVESVILGYLNPVRAHFLGNQALNSGNTDMHVIFFFFLRGKYVEPDEGKIPHIIHTG